MLIFFTIKFVKLTKVLLSTTKLIYSEWREYLVRE